MSTQGVSTPAPRVNCPSCGKNIATRRAFRVPQARKHRCPHGRSCPPLQGHECQSCVSARNAYVYLWDAIHAYTRACGGDTSVRSDTAARAEAVVAIERALGALGCAAVPPSAGSRQGIGEVPEERP